MDGYKRFIKEYPNFPVNGVNFKDISPLLADQQMFLEVIVDMGRRVRNPDYWVGIDSRGYLFSSSLATQFGGGVICARKEGKTPGEFVSKTYDLEYGTATLELQPGEGEVVIVDDVLATGGTLQAANDLAEGAGYKVVGNLVLIDLKYVPRVDNFNLDVRSVIQYG
jgi:adenine phosphoribosyltransferase